MPDVRATIHRITEAAEAFLRNLEPDQQAQATFPFDHDERENWHYVPRPRAGLARGDMTPAQLNAAESMMAVSLSAEGVRKAHLIVRHETILGELEASFGTLRFDRLEGLYYFSIFGTPGSAEPWGWQVDGHHLSLNMTVIGGERISVTPSVLRGEPGGSTTWDAQGSAYPEGGRGRREESSPFAGRRAGGMVHDLPDGST